MGKRSSFARIERDFYPTPMEAVLPLLPHLQPGTRFYEPCAGDGALIDHLEAHGHTCIGASDIMPQRPDIARADARDCVVSASSGADCIITNPPWTRDILHHLIVHFTVQRPTWMLFDAGWMHTRQSQDYLPMLRKIVSIGRVKWIAGSASKGKDDCCWYSFGVEQSPITFHGRSPCV